MLVAFVLMIVRRDVVSQAIGFFSLENGVSLASLVVAAGMPLILEVAFLFDLLVAVVVFGVLMRLHHGRAQHAVDRDAEQAAGLTCAAGRAVGAAARRRWRCRAVLPRRVGAAVTVVCGVGTLRAGAGADPGGWRRMT